jgi:cell division septum initiation protein DivIVA
MLEIAPDAISTTRLRRRLRGYDREQTDELLATVVESYGKVYAERAQLAEEVARLRREREADVRSRSELGQLRADAEARDRHVSDLQTRISRYEEEHSQRIAEIERLRAELSDARAVQDELHDELREHRDRVARSAIREKALVEQIALLAAQLEDEATGSPAISARARAVPERADRAAATLLRLERVVETLEQESRRDAELTLKKARERADEIVRSAQAERRRLDAASAQTPAEEDAGDEYDPISALARIESSVTTSEASDEAAEDIGEASWTSRPGFGDAAEPSG